MPSAVHVLQRPAETPLARSPASVAPQRYNFKCCLLNSGYTLSETEARRNYITLLRRGCTSPRLLPSWGEGCLYESKAAWVLTDSRILCVFSNFLLQHDLRLEESSFLEGKHMKKDGVVVIWSNLENITVQSHGTGPANLAPRQKVFSAPTCAFF